MPDEQFQAFVPDFDYYRSLVACQFACPVGTDARGYVTAIAKGEYEGEAMNRKGMNLQVTSSPGRWLGVSSLCFLRAWVALFLTIAITALLGGCSSGLHKASVQMIDRAEAQWQQAPVQDYEITVEVSRPDDRRRTTVIVQQGQIAQGEVSYWNAADKRWDEPYALNEEQSFPFTVPGLFEMVRGEMQNSGRVDIRVRMEDELSFPWHIVLGPVMLDGQVVSGTEATITVESYTPREE